MRLLYCCFFALLLSLTLQKAVFPFPSPLNVPKGGCVDHLIGGLGVLTSALILNINPTASPADFNVSSNQVIFSPRIPNNTITFCASNTTTLTTVPIKLSLGGPESTNYDLSSTNVAANIIAPGNIAIPSAQNISSLLSNLQSSSGTDPKSSANPSLISPPMTSVPIGINMNNLNSLLNGNGLATIPSSNPLGTPASSTPLANNNINSLVAGLINNQPAPMTGNVPTPTFNLNGATGANSFSSQPSSTTTFATPAPVIVQGTGSVNGQPMSNQAINSMVSSLIPGVGISSAGASTNQPINSLIPGLIPGLTPGQIGTPTIQVQLQTGSVTRSEAQFLITTNNNGVIYYSIQSGQHAIPPLPQLDVKSAVQSSQYIQQSPVDFMKNLYLNDRDLKVGSSNAVFGANYITLNGLSAQKTYTFCAYFQSFQGGFSYPLCTNFNTTDDFSQRASFVFTQAIQASEVNRFLCWLATYANLPPQSIVTMTGESCNINGQTPINNYYRYIGNTMYPVRQLILFFLTPALADPMATSSNFTNLFESRNKNALLKQAAKTAATSAGINFIDKGIYDGNENLLNLQSPTLVSNATLQSAANTKDGRIVIAVANSNGPTTAYLVAVPVGDGNPTSDQILNCRNSRNQQTNLCVRTALMGNESNSIGMVGANSNQNYVIYYISTSPYPMRPVTNGFVNQLSVANSPINGPIPNKPNHKWATKANVCLLLLALIALIAF